MSDWQNADDDDSFDPERKNSRSDRNAVVKIEEHLRLLGIFHYVAGALGMLFGLFPVFHVLIGYSMMTGNPSPFFPMPPSGFQQPIADEESDDGTQPPPTEEEKEAKKRILERQKQLQMQQDRTLKMMGRLFFYGGMAFIAISELGAILTILTGYYYGVRRHRIFCMVIDALLCLQVPLGTILGVFGLVTLTKDETKRLFDAVEEEPRRIGR